jgi:multiple sugar transport system substrate-binding protein
MATPIRLTGITWNHTRGLLPMVATAQRFNELHPTIEITWQKRSLQEFGDYPIERLAERFDLLVIDHPFVGYAAAHPTLLPLDEFLPPEFLADQAANSVGASHPSYTYGGHHWALAIDAATPVSSWRADLLEQAGAQVPQTWEDLLALARCGLVAMPAIPIDSLMNFYMLCLALGEEPFSTPDRVISDTNGHAALAMLRELVQACDPACLTRNPIQTYEALIRGEAAYCPFAYGYSNYARAEYAEHTLQFGGLVRYNGRALRSVLGGTGLAISLRCEHHAAALLYVQYAADPACQRGLYTWSGGQPGHRGAWEAAETNALCNGYFRATLPTLDDAYLRPRYNGYLHLQDRAGELVHACLRGAADPHRTLESINRLYRESRHDG